MNVFEIEKNQFAASPARRESDSVIFGVISEHDFARAQHIVAGLDDYDDYADWLDSREGFQMAYALAGVDAAPVLVEFESFLRWCGRTGSAPSLAALDRLAALAHAFAGASRLVVLARVDEREFGRYALVVPALHAARDFADWRERRERARSRAAGLGLQVEEMPVRMEAFVGWCDCLGQTASAPALDRYAQLLLEELTTEATAAVVNHVSLR